MTQKPRENDDQTEDRQSEELCHRSGSALDKGSAKGNEVAGYMRCE